MMSHYKCNVDTKHPPIGIEIIFNKAEGMTTFRRLNVESVVEFDGKLPLSRRITNLLKRGKLTIKEISEELGAPYNQVKARLNEMEGKKVLKLSNETWGLARIEI